MILLLYYFRRYSLPLRVSCSSIAMLRRPEGDIASWQYSLSGTIQCQVHGCGDARASSAGGDLGHKSSEDHFV